MTDMHIDTIVVPTDFSDNASAAYPYAATLAKQFDAKIVLVHVTEPIVYSIGPGQIAIGWEQLESDVRDHVEKHFADIVAKFGEVEVETLRCEGSPFVEIVRLARDRNAGMIVMATHGHTGFKHLLLGSTAEKVVRKAECPVLTVHPGERSFVLP